MKNEAEKEKNELICQTKTREIFRNLFWRQSKKKATETPSQSQIYVKKRKYFNFVQGIDRKKKFK